MAIVQSHIPVFPLGLVLVPQMPMPLHIFEERYKLMIGECIEQRWEFGVVYLREAGIQRIGCSALIADVLRRYEDGRLDILTVGTRRFLITSIDESRPFLQAEVLYFEDEPEELEQRTIELGSRAIELLKAFNRLAGSPVAPDPASSSDASGLSFYIAAHEGFTVEERQELLEMPTPSSRIEREVELLKNKIDLLAAQEAIRKIAGGNGKMRDDLNLHDPPLLQS